MPGARGLVGVGLTEALYGHLSGAGKGPSGGATGPGRRAQGVTPSWVNPPVEPSVSGQLSLSRLICEMELTRAGGMAHRTLAAPPGRLWGRRSHPAPGLGSAAWSQLLWADRGVKHSDTFFREQRMRAGWQHPLICVRPPRSLGSSLGKIGKITFGSRFRD